MENQAAKEATFLKSVNFILLLAGKRVLKQNNKFILVIYKFYSFFVHFWMPFFHLFYILAIVLGLDCKYYLRETMSSFCRSVGCLVLPFMINSADMQEILALINKNESDINNFEENDIKKIYAKSVKRINRLVTISISVMTAVLILWTTHIDTMVIDEIDPKVKCSMPEGQIFQFNFSSNTVIQKMIADLVPYVGGVFILYARSFPTVTVGYVLTQIKLLQAYIRKVEEKTNEISRRTNLAFDKCRLIVLKEIAEKHQNIIRLTEKVQSMNRAVVFLFYFGDSAFTASFAITIVKSNDISKSFNEVWVVIATLIGLYVFSLVANDIIYESSDIADILFYETNWTDYDEKSKSVIFLMIMRAQQPLAINTPIIGDMSLNTFLQIIKLCYTIQTFFATTNTE